MSSSLVFITRDNDSTKQRKFDRSEIEELTVER